MEPRQADVVWKLQCNEKNERYKRIIRRMSLAIATVVRSSENQAFQNDVGRAVKCRYKPGLLEKRLEDYITTAAVKQLRLSISPVVEFLGHPCDSSHKENFGTSVSQTLDFEQLDEERPPPLKRSRSSPPQPLLNIREFGVSESAPSPEAQRDFCEGGLSSFPQYGRKFRSQDFELNGPVASTSGFGMTDNDSQTTIVEVDDGCNVMSSVTPACHSRQSGSASPYETPLNRTYSQHLLVQAASVLSQLPGVEQSPACVTSASASASFAAQKLGVTSVTPPNFSSSGQSIVETSDVSNLFSPESGQPTSLASRSPGREISGCKSVKIQDADAHVAAANQWVDEDPDLFARGKDRLKLPSGVWSGALNLKSTIAHRSPSEQPATVKLTRDNEGGAAAEERQGEASLTAAQDCTALNPVQKRVASELHAASQLSPSILASDVVSSSLWSPPARSEKQADLFSPPQCSPHKAVEKSPRNLCSPDRKLYTIPKQQKRNISSPNPASPLRVEFSPPSSLRRMAELKVFLSEPKRKQFVLEPTENSSQSNLGDVYDFCSETQSMSGTQSQPSVIVDLLFSP